MPEEKNGASALPNQPADQASADNSSAPLSVSNLQQHDAANTDAPNSSHKSYRHYRQLSQSQSYPSKLQSQYNRKNYGQKGNHQNQYSNYSAAQAAQAQAQAAQAFNSMYYGYYQPGYGYMMPVNPYPSAQSPGMVSPNPYTAIPGSPAVPVVSPPPHIPGKVKITDKDGKQIDLEEKKKVHASTASATPISSPQQSIASPIKAPAVLAKPAAPVVKPAASTTTTGKDGVVLEDFKEKVKRLAAAAKAKKEAEAKAKQEAEAKAEQAQTPQASEQPQSDAQPQSEPEQEQKPKPAEPEPLPTRQPEPESKPAEPVVAEPVKEEQNPEPTEPAALPTEQLESKPEATEPIVAPTAVPEPVKAQTPEPVKIEEPASQDKSVEPPVEDKTENIASNELAVEPPNESVPETEEKVGENEESGVEDDDEEEGEGEGDDDAAGAEEEEPTMNLTQFFARLNEVEPIPDPYSVEYPEPLVGVDSKWKSETKKYRYDPQFLIQFRDVVQLEIDEEWNNKLLGLGIVATQRENKKFGSGVQRGGSNRFGNGLPGRFNSMSGRGGQFGDGRQNSRNGSKRRGGGSTRDKSKRNNQSRRKGESEPTIAPEDIKPLEKSANRWVPKSRVKKDEVKYAPDGVTPILDEEDIERKVKSLLNKLTLEMFEPITDDILKICDQSKWEDDAKTVKQIISLTFAKACDEPYWSSMYAQFCAKMCTQLSDEIVIEDFNGAGRKFGGDLARRLLLATCQREYEKGWSDKLPQNDDGTPLEMLSDEYYTMAAAKRRGLGLVKFIGQLYLLNMLNDRVVILCLTSSSKNTVDPSEDSLESLAQLITAIGPKFEQTEKNKSIMQSIFDSILKILANVKLSSRIKFMLMDLQDTRRNGWVSAKQETGPKTIKEIHDDAEIKRLEDEKAAIERRRKNKSNDSRSNSTRGGSNWGSQPKRVESSSRITPLKDSKGFTAVQRSQSNRINDSSFTLSPRENSKRTDSVQSSANMFAALDGDDNDNDDENENVNENET